MPSSIFGKPTAAKVVASACLVFLLLLWIFVDSGFLFRRGTPSATSEGDLETVHDIPLTYKVDEFTYSVLSPQHPRVLFAKNFLSSEECDHLIDLARPSLSRSLVASDKDHKEVDSQDDVRTSSGAWLSRHSSDFAMRAFVRRVSAWVDLQPDHAEDVQILQYEVGQQYLPHVDYFDPSVYERYLRNGGQRVASVLCFLNDVPHGGETTFPRIGVDVTPEKGSAILWFNADRNGTLDQRSLHGGKPVLEGRKYVAVQWMRQFPRA